MSFYAVSAEVFIFYAVIANKQIMGIPTASKCETSSAVIFCSLVSHTVNMTGICPHTSGSGSKRGYCARLLGPTGVLN